MSRNGRTAAASVTMDPKKRQRIKKELDHLGEIFREVDENKRDFVQRHIEQLAWYNVSIADLQAKVDQFGTLVMYDNGGGQSGVKPNPDVKTLLDYQKCCNTIVRTLIALVPEKVNKDDFLNFESWQKTPEEIEEEYQAEEERRKRINAEIAAAQKKLEESRAKNGN